MTTRFVALGRRQAWRQHVRNGLITIRTAKTGITLALPLRAPLAESVAAAKTGDLAFIVGEWGGP